MKLSTVASIILWCSVACTTASASLVRRRRGQDDETEMMDAGSPTIAELLDKGFLTCGVIDGFNTMADDGTWSGFDVEFVSATTLFLRYYFYASVL